MVRNNLQFSDREMKNSPVCWYNIKVNSYPEINALSATQQDLFFFFLYMGKWQYERAWALLSEDKWAEDEAGIKHKTLIDRPIAYITDYRPTNYKWPLEARKAGYFEFDVAIADVVRAIRYTGKTGKLIDEIMALDKLVIAAVDNWNFDLYSQTSHFKKCLCTLKIQ